MEVVQIHNFIYLKINTGLHENLKLAEFLEIKKYNEIILNVFKMKFNVNQLFVMDLDEIMDNALIIINNDKK